MVDDAGVKYKRNAMQNVARSTGNCMSVVCAGMQWWACTGSRVNSYLFYNILCDALRTVYTKTDAKRRSNSACLLVQNTKETKNNIRREGPGDSCRVF